MSTTIKYDGSGLPWYKIFNFLTYTPLKHVLSCADTKTYGIKNSRLRSMVAKGLKNNSIAYSSYPGVTICQINKLARVVMSELSNIISPTIILHSREDDTASIKNADIVEEHIGAKVIRKVILDDCYHMITIDNQRDAVAKEIITFFKKFAQQINFPAVNAV
jgi:carboxylesterase